MRARVPRSRSSFDTALQDLESWITVSSDLAIAPPLTARRAQTRERLLVQAAKGVDMQAYLRAWLSKVKIPASVRAAVDVDPKLVGKLLSEVAPDTTVLTLDTGLLFPETYALMNELETRLNLRLIRVKPALTVAQQAGLHGDELWAHNPDQCCGIRKTVPLNEALANYDAWITGLRRDQSSGRAQTEPEQP